MVEAKLENIIQVQKKIEEGYPSVEEIQAPLKFLSVFTITTTVHDGSRTEGSAIKPPVELENKRFKITDIYISAISSTLEAVGAGDNLLVGLSLNGKSLLAGASQTFNGITTSLDMLDVPLVLYEPTLKVCSRKAHYKLLSELFTNLKVVKIVYSHLSTTTVHYLIYITIGGVIL